MPKPRLTPIRCVVATNGQLRVEFEWSLPRSVPRRHALYVPTDMLPWDDVTRELDRIARRRLIEAWSDTPLPEM